MQDYKTPNLNRKEIGEWLSLGCNRKLDGEQSGYHSVRGKYGVNITNLWSIAEEWNHLEENTTQSIRDIFNTSVEWKKDGKTGIRHWAAWGMKKSDEFTCWMVMLSMMEVWSMPGVEGDLINSNIRRGLSNPTEHRILSPRTANWRGKRWTSQRAATLKTMFKRGLRCKSIVIQHGTSGIGDGWASSIWNKYEGVEKSLAKGVRGKKIAAYFYSHELSCTSILGEVLNPHTHVVVWYHGKYNHESVRDLFNSDCEVKPDHREFKSLTKGFERNIVYLHGVYSWVAPYKREWTPEVSSELLTKTINLVNLSVELFHSRRKVGCGGIPKDVCGEVRENLPDWTCGAKIFKNKYTYEEKQSRVQNRSNRRTGSERSIKRSSNRGDGRARRCTRIVRSEIEQTQRDESGNRRREAVKGHKSDGCESSINARICRTSHSRELGIQKRTKVSHAREWSG